jgi:hypothetical protein
MPQFFGGMIGDGDKVRHGFTVQNSGLSVSEQPFQADDKVKG